MRPLVIIESPYKGNTLVNLEYARVALLDSIMRGEAPLASHLLYTQVLDDTVDRRLGMELGWEWFRAASLVAFYTDLGMSSGMREALKYVIKHRLKHEERSIKS